MASFWKGSLVYKSTSCIPERFTRYCHQLLSIGQPQNGSLAPNCPFVRLICAYIVLMTYMALAVTAYWQ